MTDTKTDDFNEEADRVRRLMQDSAEPEIGPIDVIIEDYRTDNPKNLAKRKFASRSTWVLECLAVLTAYDDLMQKKTAPDNGFTLAELYYHMQRRAITLDHVFKLKTPFAIRFALLQRHADIYSINTRFTYWFRDLDCPFIKTGKKITSFYSAQPGAMQTEYKLHPDLLDQDFLKENYRERLIAVITNVTLRQKGSKTNG